MKTIDLGNAKICLIDDHIVLFEANADVVIDKDVAQFFMMESRNMSMATTAWSSTVRTSTNCCGLKFFM